MGVIDPEEYPHSASNIEPAEDVRARWNIINPDFCARLRQHEFFVFFCPGLPRKSPDGDIVYICTRGKAENLYYEYDDGFGDLTGVFLLRSQVREHEKQYQYLTYPVVKDGASNEEKSSAEMSQDAFLSAGELCKRWGVSPARLVGLVQSDGGLPVYWRKEDDVPF